MGLYASLRLQVLHEQLDDDEAARRRLGQRLDSVRAAIAKAEADLQAARLQEHALEAQITQKDRFITEQRKAISPVVLLPQDTLVEIFLWAQTEPPCANWTTEQYATFMAFRLAAICRRWRDAALSSPRLWSQILFDFRRFAPNTPHGARMSRYRGLQLQLLLSREVPLCVNLQNYDPLRAQEAFYGTTFQSVIRTSSRWRVFILTVETFGAGDSCVLHHFRAATPLLEEFSLYNTEEGFIEDEDEDDDVRLLCDPGHPVDFLVCAPHLRTLVIEGCVLEHIVRPTFPQLQTLSVQGGRNISSAKLAIFLAAHDFLEEIDLWAYCQTDEAAHNDPPPNIRFSRLRRLTLALCGTDVLAPHIAALAMPNLERLVIGAYNNTPQEHEFLRFCSSIVELYATSGEELAPGAVPALLRDLPKLRSVTLSRFCVFADDFAPLARKDAALDRWVCPELTSVQLVQPDFSAADTARAILDFVKTRAVGEDGAAKLTRFSIQYGEGPPWLTHAIGLVLGTAPDPDY